LIIPSRLGSLSIRNGLSRYRTINTQSPHPQFHKFISQNYRLPLLIVAGHYVSKYLMAIAIRSLVEWVQKNRRVRVPFQEQFRWLMPIGFCASLDIGLSNWFELEIYGNSL
jgi:hypothetical protein